MELSFPAEKCVFSAAKSPTYREFASIAFSLGDNIVYA